MLSEFRTFILRGNVIDLAVGVVIGGAFGAVVTSFVGDILTPLLGLIGVPDFSSLVLEAGSASVNYGIFLNALIAFVLVAAAIFFFIVKPMNAMGARMKKAEPTAAPTAKGCPFCATEIPLAATRCPNCTSRLS
jgi:large conductance mechanosensitive channel